jgi:hypothetical protein
MFGRMPEAGASLDFSLSVKSERISDGTADFPASQELSTFDGPSHRIHTVACTE